MDKYYRKHFPKIYAWRSGVEAFDYITRRTSHLQALKFLKDSANVAWNSRDMMRGTKRHTTSSAHKHHNHGGQHGSNKHHKHHHAQAMPAPQQAETAIFGNNANPYRILGSKAGKLDESYQEKIGIKVHDHKHKHVGLWKKKRSTNSRQLMRFLQPKIDWSWHLTDVAGSWVQASSNKLVQWVAGNYNSSASSRPWGACMALFELQTIWNKARTDLPGLVQYTNANQVLPSLMSSTTNQTSNMSNIPGLSITNYRRAFTWENLANNIVKITVLEYVCKKDTNTTPGECWIEDIKSNGQSAAGTTITEDNITVISSTIEPINMWGDASTLPGARPGARHKFLNNYWAKTRDAEYILQPGSTATHLTKRSGLFVSGTKLNAWFSGAQGTTNYSRPTFLSGVTIGYIIILEGEKTYGATDLTNATNLVPASSGYKLSLLVDGNMQVKVPIIGVDYVKFRSQCPFIGVDTANDPFLVTETGTATLVEMDAAEIPSNVTASN